MSDADDQMGGHGGETGKDPADQSDAAPDPKKGNMGEESGSGSEDQNGPDDLPVEGKPQGEDQAQENREKDPPA